MIASMVFAKSLRQVRIGDKLVGDGHPAYIVAEAGVNHDGSVERALQLADLAAEAGADAVKFQVFSATQLVTATAAKAAYQESAAGETQRDMLARLELTDDEFAAVRDRCVQRGVEFLATPFGRADLRRLLGLGVRAVKTASTDLDNLPLLRDIAAAELPLIVSTGAATHDEITRCVSRLLDWGVGERLLLLHCVSSYPTPLDAANLRAIGALRREFDVLTGYSDHTLSPRTGAWAVAAGASILEKHLTHDRSAAGPDHAMSLDAVGLREYVCHVRAAELALGGGGIGMSEVERDVRDAARKSVVTARPIRAGAALTDDMLTAKRPGGGISPERTDDLLGRRILDDTPADVMLTWEMVE